MRRAASAVPIQWMSSALVGSVRALDWLIAPMVPRGRSRLVDPHGVSCLQALWIAHDERVDEPMIRLTWGRGVPGRRPATDHPRNRGKVPGWSVLPVRPDEGLGT